MLLVSAKCIFSLRIRVPQAIIDVSELLQSAIAPLEVSLRRLVNLKVVHRRRYAGRWAQ